MKAKYKNKGGKSKLYKRILQKRLETKAAKKERRLRHGKFPRIPELGYIFTYKVEKIVDRDYTFADLHKFKLVDTISIYSTNNDRSIIDNILKDRKNWPYNNEIAQLDYKFVDCIQCETERLDTVRKSNGWQISLNQTKGIIEKSLLTPDANLTIQTYSCFTTVSYLCYLQQKYKTKGWLFSKEDSGNKVFLLKKIESYNNLLNKGKVLVTDLYLAKQCLKLRNKFGHKVEFIYDHTLLPKTVTKLVNKRKQRTGVPRHTLDNDPNKQRLVCITDGNTVTRLKWYKATKIVHDNPSIKFCTKSEYNKYLNELRPKPYLPKDKREVIRTLSIQGCKEGANYPGTGVRKDRKALLQKKKSYNRLNFEQYVPETQKWVTDPEDENFETLVTYPAKTINVRKKRYTYVPRLDHHAHARARKERLLKAYKEYFAQEERRNDKFSGVEKWSKEFMEILGMVKSGKPEHLIATKLSIIFPGWNDKKMKRFIQYLKLTRHGLNYKPNVRKQVVVKYEKYEKNVKGITISKFPYHQPIVVDYKTTDSDGAEKIVREQNVWVQQKKVLKEDPETKEMIVLCPIKDVEKWVLQDKYTEEDTCPWKPFIAVTTLTKVAYRKIPFHLPVKKQKKKKWRHPISTNKCESKHLPF